MRDFMKDLRVGLLLAFVSLLLIVMPIAPFVQTAQAQEPIKNIQNPFASAARTASANSSAYPVGEADVLVLYVSNTATSGSSPTLDVKMQDSPDGGTTWFDIAGAAITQVTSGTSSQIVTATRKFSKTVRVVVTIGGSSPSFTCAVWFMTYKSYG
jgi:hypothetical protein